MKNVLLCVLSTSAALSALTLICLALMPLLEKRYSPKGLYTAAVVVMLGFLVPFSLLIPKPLVTVELPTRLSAPLFPAVTEPAAAPEQSDPQLFSAAVTESSATLQTPHPPVTAAPVQAVQKQLPTESTPAASAAGERLRSVNLLDLLGWVWLGGAVCFFAMQLMRHHRFMRTLRRWQKPCENTAYLHILSRLQKDMGLENCPGLKLSPSAPSPMLVGFFNPTVYLPDESLTPDELVLVLRHELTHYQRRDLLVKAALLLCRGVHWFNPVMLPLSRWLNTCQESSCDSCVTQNASQEERRFYSETILRAIRRQVRARTQLCTSFYGGKEGMKKRIFSIMNTSKRRAGVLLCLCLVLGTLLCGCAMTLKDDPAVATPANAWVHAKSGNGTVLVMGASAGDLNCPMGIYLNGTPVTIQQVEEGSAAKEWNCKDNRTDWAEVLIGGDGYDKGIHGWMPLRDLVFESDDTLPAAALNAADGSDTSLYSINDRETPVAAQRATGTEVKVLGQLNHWMHVALEDESLFVLTNDIKLSPEADKLLWELLPDRFAGVTRAEYDARYFFGKLYDEKSALYNGDPLDFWSVEDKAWYSEMNGTYSVYDTELYYCLPGEGDLAEEKAVEIALTAYAGKTGKEKVTTEDVEVYPGFYRIGYTGPYYWEVVIRLNGDDEIIARIAISNPDGKVLTINSEQADLVYGLTPPEGNG